ncbi:MAG: GDP-mannose 4,6-dehydratase [Minisyncoccia bacterium]
MKTVLVTGGAGFIGSNLSGELLKRGYRVVCIDNFDPLYDPRFKEGNIEPFRTNSNYVLYKSDIREFENLKDIFKKEKPTYVVHLAARPDTRDAVKNPWDYISVNIGGTLNVLEACKDSEIENLVMASSSSVYGNDPSMPWSESIKADKPLSPYGATKKTTELLAHSYQHNFGLNITCIRYFNAYGENNRPTMVPYIWTDAILNDKEIEISGDGSRSRDYTYIGDVVEGTILAMEKPLGFEVLNIGNSDPVSLNELLSVFEKVTGIKAKVKSRPSHKASVESTFADITKAKILLGWEPKTSIEDGIEKLVTWFRNNRLKDSV